VIAGREEARLIYLGVAHTLPNPQTRQLVVDIGGGSTEFIIGQNIKPIRLESLYMGCVSFSLRFFPDGRVDKRSFKEAELAARRELQAIVTCTAKRAGTKPSVPRAPPRPLSICWN
jgi:exopolyphosphatase/guanosine-5'-triphosphate,3'-diphosphate pyrophosphatase